MLPPAKPTLKSKPALKSKPTLKSKAALKSRWPLAALLSAIVGSAFGGDVVRERLAWDRARLIDGEWWRLVTGHLVHSGWTHTLESALACTVLLAWPKDTTLGALKWSGAIAVLALVISLGLLLPDWPATYLGLSGVLHGLFAIFLLASARFDRVDGLLLLALWAKVFYEQVGGALPGSSELIGLPVAVDAHLIGTGAGTALGLLHRFPFGIRSGARDAT